MMDSVKEGKLREMSPFGTGFIEDTQTGTFYGFHITMLPKKSRPTDPQILTGSDVRFELQHNGSIGNVSTYASTLDGNKVIESN